MYNTSVARTAAVLIGLISLALISPVPLRAWRVSAGNLHRVPLPPGIRPLLPSQLADLDADGHPDLLLLEQEVLKIKSQGNTRWISPVSWKVQQALIADLNGDQQPEAVLLVSRPFQSWPVDAWLPHGGRIDDFHDAGGYSSHVILIGWDGTVFRELWAGSALAAPVIRIATVPLQEGSGAYLVTLEKEYDDPHSAPARRMKIWTWNGFGFGIVSSVDGPFTGLVVSRAVDGGFLIITQ
jgi:hypothetical protein